MIHLFLLKLLDNSRCRANIEWVDKYNRLFKVVTPSAIAKLWKHIKGNKTDNYECFARGIRHSRDIGRYFEPHGFRQKKIYKFSPKAIEDYHNCQRVAAAAATATTMSSETLTAASTSHGVNGGVEGDRQGLTTDHPTATDGCDSSHLRPRWPGPSGDGQSAADEDRRASHNGVGNGSVSGGCSHSMPNPEVLERLKSKLAERRLSSAAAAAAAAAAAPAASASVPVVAPPTTVVELKILDAVDFQMQNAPMSIATSVGAIRVLETVHSALKKEVVEVKSVTTANVVPAAIPSQTTA
uniref:ETS domain-containing protein n=1 Tax=Macrostomum lignano TaxID=282301 RepID=A0A1I8HT79_9PLAT